MSDAEREAAIRLHVAQIRAMAPYENVQKHVTFLLCLLDQARAEIAEQSEQLFALANELREAREAALEEAAQLAERIYDPATSSAHRHGKMIASAIRALSTNWAIRAV